MTHLASHRHTDTAKGQQMAAKDWEQGPLELPRLRERARFYALRAHAADDLTGDRPATSLPLSIVQVNKQMGGCVRVSCEE